MGRRSKYLQEYDGIAERACEQFGATDAQLSEMLNVTEKTLNNWKCEHESFLQSIKRGKSQFDQGAVEQALHDGATGYFFPQQLYDSAKGKVITLWQFKHAETAKIALWLCNRDRERWQHVQGRAKQVDSKVVEPHEEILSPEAAKDYDDLAEAILSRKYGLARRSG
jgi:hypothetical protein